MVMPRDSGLSEVKEREHETAVPVARSRPKSLMSNAGWSLLWIAWITVLGFVLTPFLIGHLGPSYYGLWVLLATVSGTLRIMDLGLGEATLRYVAHYYGRGDTAGINRTVGATQSVYIVTGGLSWAVLSFGAPWVASLLALPPEDLDLAIELLRLTAIGFGLTIASSAFGAIPRALQRYDVDATVRIGESVLLLAGTVVILQAGMGIHELVVWSLVTTVARQVVGIVIAKRLIPNLWLLPHPSRAGLREIFGYGFFATVTRTLGIAGSQADRLVLATLFSTSAVTYLAVPKNLVLRGTNAVATVGNVLFPRFSATAEVDSRRRLFLDAVWTMLTATIVLFVPVTVLMPDFLRLWVGPEIAQESATVGQLFALGCLVRGAFVPVQMLLQGTGKPQYVTAWFLGSSLTNLLLVVLLVPTLGLVGTGYAFVLQAAWGLVALLLTWKRVLQPVPWRPLGRAFVLPSALALVSLALAWLVRSSAPEPGWLGLLGMGSLLLVVTALLVVGVEWLLGGPDSHAGTLFEAVGRTVRSGPWAKWRESRRAGRSGARLG